jgi:hypothetical protein
VLETDPPLDAQVAVPCGGAHLELAREHQRAGGTDLDAVAAVHARRVGQRNVVLGRHAGVEARPAMSIKKLFCHCSPHASTH